MTKEQQEWVDSLSTEKLIEVLEKEHDSIDEKFEKYMRLRQNFYKSLLGCLLPAILLCFTKNVTVQIVLGIIIVIMFVGSWLFLFLRKNDYDEYFMADQKIDDLEEVLHDRYKSATEKEKAAIANYFFDTEDNEEETVETN